ncbi:DNA-directed RNA polymerase subunit A' [Candidatus Woesearchaeota archaeon]|nr:DNA-directed RNA polymerase subunit A' [Candidatus Woesearchaeota archaeon]
MPDDAQTQYVYKKVNSIVFGVLSPKMIKKMSSAKVVTPELYDKEGYPVDGGLMDTRLGVIDPGLKCRTCGSKLKECVGHFGYIELARPVIHVKYVNLIQVLLKATCRECGKVMIPKAKKEKYLVDIKQIKDEKGLDKMRTFVKSVVLKDMLDQTKCPHCKTRQHKVAIEKPTTYLENDKRLSPIEIRTRLEKIPDEDLPLFSMEGTFVRPEWLVLTVLPIPPVTMRPSITLESGERSEDDLTHKLGDIVRINQRLFENINAGAPEIIIEDLWDLLQYHVTTFFDNDIAQLPPARHRSGQPLKTITERIKSKEGRIRHNLAGKRTNFSSRTVISPDPMIGLNEVGVPKIVAMKLTVPEMATEWNIEYLKKFVERGPKVYPGANYVIRPDGKKKRVTDEMKEQILEEIQPGYTVERHLMDGDIAIFNRQPSLHKMSMMCHEVRVLPAKTFRLNPAVCAPYNADFDGDEMNLHIPQTEEARAEAETLMKVQTQLISSGFGLSVIGCVQDGISGNYILTKSLDVPREAAIGILMSVGIDDYSKLPKDDKISGKDIFSMLLPPDFDFIGKDKSGQEVLVKKGKLMSGVMDTANLGKGSGIMLRDLHKKYGAKFTSDFISNAMKLGIYVIMYHGFTTSVEDTDLPPEARKKLNETLDEAYKKVDMLIDLYHKNELETFPGKTMAETLELKILEALNKARNKTGNIVDEYSNKETGTISMSRSGSRGKPLNLAQMAGCVGQQAMRGGRISSGYKNRTMSCFKPGDLSPAAHGFIRNSFKNGLTPAEFFFMGMTGRDSLMDTALRTPKSGYLYRRLANALQDLKVEYDNTVRDASKKIVQFSYGEDGIDVSKSEKGTINVKRIIAEIAGR